MADLNYSFGRPTSTVRRESSGPITLESTDGTVLLNTTGANIVANLPPLDVSYDGKVFVLKNIGTGGNDMIPTAAGGGDQIELTSSWTTGTSENIAEGNTVTYVGDNTNKKWWII
jgi:hypothetical protein